MKKELQQAQDLIDAMQKQRDDALNANVVAGANLAASQRECLELKTKIHELEAKLMEQAPGVNLIANGHDEAAAPAG